MLPENKSKPGFKRIALGVRYDGSAYHGWQSQGELNTIQERLERALSRVANHPIIVTCAGRTDAGVHATAQVVHFDTEADRSEYSWTFGANSNLPHDVSVIWAKHVESDFHARFSASGRRYRYVIFNQPVRPAVMHRYVSWYHKHLDEKRMEAAAEYLVGRHDFSAFRGAGCQAKTTVRTMHQLTVNREGRMVIIEAHANAFLLHMVRNIVGVLIDVGSGAKEPEWVKMVLESRDRAKGGVTMTPNGLYLIDVEYPGKYLIPQTPSGPFFLS